jgi:endonuclease YncB( thermonuclease family)
MSLASRLFTAVVGLALIWFFWPFGGGGDEVVKIVEPPSGHEGRLFTTPLPDANPPKKPAPPEEDSADTAGDQVAAIAPKAAQEAKPKLKATRYYRVTVHDGGTLETRGKIVIKLDGIQAHAADEICKDASGKAWACGTRARVALIRFIRGRAVVCRAPETGKAKAVTARCTVGGTDLSEWMLSQGWVKPGGNADTKLAEAADGARKKKIGVWR